MAQYNPSRPLKNPKHEQFAQLVARGLTLVEAYEQAGYAASSPNAAHLAGKADVKARIEWLRSQTQGKVIAKIARVTEEAAERAAKATVVVMESDAETRQWVKDMLRHNAEVSLGLVTIPIISIIKKKTKTGDGGFVEELEGVRVEITDRDPAAANRALELLGKAVGMTFDGEIKSGEGTGEHGLPPALAGISDAQLWSELNLVAQKKAAAG